MHRHATAILCFITILAGKVHAQKASIEPIHVTAGTVLTFYLQTRLNPGSSNVTDILPKGTVMRVRVLDDVDSNVDRDGTEFRGAVVSSVVSENEIVVHSRSEVRGLLALLRSKNHPDGFRYELLITGVSDHGKSYDLTASLNPSFSEAGTQRESAAKPETASTVGGLQQASPN
jgi:hypothetical protein